MSQEYDVVIVGGGHAGAQAAAALRQAAFKESIAVIGEDPNLPYERPPLSKEYLAGERSFDRMLLRPETFWRDREISILTGVRASIVDAEARTICANGSSISYRKLIWAAGGSARRLTCSGHDLGGVFTVRTRADADAISAALGQVNEIVVIGGGYIGLEAAAVLSKMGKKVTVLEALSRVLARVAGEPLSRFFEEEHRSHGVEIRLEARVDSLIGRDGVVAGVCLANGEILKAQMVIVGIGIIPSVAPLLEAGAAGSDGIHVDEYCRTSLPDIYAIGDCASHQSRFLDEKRIRLESVQNANDQAATVAKAIIGSPAPYTATPWFWSNQYDLRLQTVGLSAGHDAVVVRGDPKTRSFSVVYFRDGRIAALDCVNTPRDYVQGRKLVEGRVSMDKTAVADAEVALKDMPFVA